MRNETNKQNNSPGSTVSQALGWALSTVNLSAWLDQKQGTYTKAPVLIKSTPFSASFVFGAPQLVSYVGYSGCGQRCHPLDAAGVGALQHLVWFLGPLSSFPSIIVADNNNSPHLLGGH